MTESSDSLPSIEASVEILPGIGPKRAALLAQLGIASLRDLVFHFPRDYQDRRHILSIQEASDRKGETVTVEGEVISARAVRLRGRMSMAVVRFKDATGEMTATFFGRGFLARAFTAGTRGLFTGVAGTYQGPALKNPEYEILSGDEEDRLHTGRVVPVYRLTQDVTQRLLRRWIATALDAIDPASIPDVLPASLRAQNGWPPAMDALRAAHFPETIEAGQTARARFAYEELLSLQTGVLLERARHKAEERGRIHRTDGPRLAAFRTALPFQLTQAQQRATQEILADMTSPRPMMRLLQGDVGSGKTVVALHAALAAADSGCQTAVMAPTEVLAEQHYLVMRDWLAPLGLRVTLLTGSIVGAKALRKDIERGEADIVVGTQALIEDKTVFHDLGLVIIDEQHRFGVVQRARLAEKGLYPDVLQMSATPIPRTLALTVYGGMDILVLDELPPGRLPVKTRRIPEAKVAGLHQYIVEQAREGCQTYYICPLVEESDKRDLTAVTTHYEALSAGPLAEVRTALLHGRLDPDQKEEVMGRFKRGEVDVLFSTTVIEVGVDVPNATIMAIEDAGQFGLTQLHQLRGRVGRSVKQSYCFLLGAPKTPEGEKRLEILCETNDGFRIAEEDLEMRGPGEFYGVRQAGLTDLHAADLIRDARLLDQARRDARELLERDPLLTNPGHAALAAAATRFQQLQP